MEGGGSGKRVGNYILTLKLGSGSFAHVFKGIHSQTQEEFAIKAIPKEKIGADSKAQTNLESEISIMRDYQHINIVRLFEHFKSSRCIYLVLELCPGGDLSKFIKKFTRVEESVSQGFLRQISDGLFFLSSRNLIHRDLKPANVLLTECSNNAILKLSDFGFAKHLQEAALAQTPCGTPLYMAPEIFEHQEYDAKADLWSVGCIFYEMLVGTYPFRGKDTRELYNNIKTKSLSVPPDIHLSKESKVLLQRLLERNPLRRCDLVQFYDACRFLPLTSATGNLETPPVAAAPLSPEPQSTRLGSSNVYAPAPPQPEKFLPPSIPVHTVPSSQRRVDSVATSVQVSTEGIINQNLAREEIAAARIHSGESSKGEATDDDYVVVEQATHPWRENEYYGAVFANMTPPSLFQGEANKAMNLPSPMWLGKSLESKGDMEDSAAVVKTLMSHCQFVCELATTITALADALVRGASILDPSLLKNRSRSPKGGGSEAADSPVTSACPLYLHSLALLRHVMQQTLDTEHKLESTSFNQKNNWIHVFDPLKQSMLNLFDQVLSRVENGRRYLESSEPSVWERESDKSPCARMYEAATRLAREAGVEELLGNLNKASQQYRAAGVLMKGLLLSCLPDPAATQPVRVFSEKCIVLSEACQRRYDALY